MARWWGGRRRQDDEQAGESRAVLDHAGTLPPQWLTQYGARTGSRWAADVFAALLTDGATDAAGLPARLADGRAPAREGGPRRPVDADLLTRYVRMLAASRDVPRDDLSVLLDHLAGRLEKGRISRTHLLVLAQAYAGEGRPDEVVRALTRRGVDDVVNRLLLADVANPWGDGPGDEAAWWSLVDGLFADVEAPRLDGAGPTPFDRLSATAAPVESPASVSVLMSCFRPDASTVAAARSIVAQSWTDWELLVLDDASGPAYDAVLEEVAALDERVRVLRAEVNAGTYARRNDGLAAARGDFVTMHDSDDWAHPRRLEVQVRHALDHPEQPGNWIPCLRASERLEFVTGRSGRVSLAPAEAGLLFRRQPVLERIGYYDPVRRAADREYRLRLEAATGAGVAEIETGAPLELCRVAGTSLSAPDFAGSWIHPARLAYRGAFGHWHRAIAAGESDPYLDPVGPRRFPVPARLVGAEAAYAVDVLVLLDVRPEANPDGFVDAVAAEMADLVARGTSVGVAHVESLAPTLEQGVLPASLQALVQDGRVTRVLLADDRGTAATTVVRTVSVLQGQPAVRLPVTTQRVVLVEDVVSGRDRRGENVALHEAVATATAQLGVAPEHVVLDHLDRLADVYAGSR